MDIRFDKNKHILLYDKLKKQIINLLLFTEAILNYELRNWGFLEASTSLVACPWYCLLLQNPSPLSQHQSFCNLSLYFSASPSVIYSHVYLPSPPLEGKLHGGRDFDWLVLPATGTGCIPRHWHSCRQGQVAKQHHRRRVLERGAGGAGAQVLTAHCIPEQHTEL